MAEVTSKDITHILRNWSVSDTELSARKIVGVDGTELLQLRIDLGVLQMFFDGRPDGERPFGRPTLLDHLTRMMQSHPHERLEAGMWTELEREIMQFYHRRRALLILGARTQNEGREGEAATYYLRAVRDADHNLRTMDFIKAHNDDEEFVASHERYRPFVLMHRTLAEAQTELIRRNPDEAIERLKAGQAAIQDVHHRENREEFANQDPWLLHLRALEQHVRRQHQIDKTLREQLAEAIENEEFELAAEIRNRLREKRRLNPKKHDA